MCINAMRNTPSENNSGFNGFARRWFANLYSVC